MNQLQVKRARRYITTDLLGSQREMKSCFCPNCCFQKLKVEFGFLLTSQAQLRAVRPRTPGLHLCGGEVEGRGSASAVPTDLGDGQPQVHGQVWGGVRTRGSGVTSDGRRGGSDPLLLTQLREQVSDAIGDAGLGTCHRWDTTVVLLECRKSSLVKTGSTCEGGKGNEPTLSAPPPPVCSGGKSQSQ